MGKNSKEEGVAEKKSSFMSLLPNQLCKFGSKVKVMCSSYFSVEVGVSWGLDRLANVGDAHPWLVE